MNVRKLASSKFAFPVIAAIILALVPLFVWDPYLVHLAILLLMNIAITQGWNIIGGYTGYVSFGHAVFFGIGAYTAGMLEVYLNINPFISMIVGGITASIFALITAYPFLKLRGPYFALGTLGLAEMIKTIIINEKKWTKGAIGLEIPGKFFVRTSPLTYYLTIYTIALASILLVYAVEHSDLGLALKAIRDNPDAAEMSGVNSTKYAIIAYTLSAITPGLAGAFYINYMTYIDPYTVFSASISVGCVAMAEFGGSGTVLGPVLGTAIIFALTEFLRGVLIQTYLIVYGVLLIIVVMFMPGGVLRIITGERPFRIPVSISMPKLSQKTES